MGGTVGHVGLSAVSTGTGPGAMLHAAWSSGKIALGSPALDFSKPTFIVLAIYGLFYYFQRYAADQTVVQRYLAARSDRDAARGVVIGSLLCIPVWTLFMWRARCAGFISALPVSGFRPMPQRPTRLSLISSRRTFRRARRHFRRRSLRRCDGESIVGSECAFGRRSRRLLPRDSTSSTDRQRLLCAKFLVAAFGALCVVVATALAHTNGTALSMWYTVSAIAAGGLAGLFLLAFLASAGAAAANIGIAASLAFTAYATLTIDGGKLWNLGRFNFPLHNYMIGVIGHVVLLTAGCTASLFLPNRDQRSRQLTWRAGRRKAKYEIAGT